MVGLGAVGAVYAHYLRLGGAQVGAFVRARHVSALERGLALHRLSPVFAPRSASLTGLQLFSEPGQVTRDWDQVWICTASPALRDAELALVLGRCEQASVVFIQPDLEDRVCLEQFVDPDRLVQGLISFLSYQAPLPGGDPSLSGISYALLPGAATRFGGEAARVEAVVRLLKRGGFPAGRHPSIPALSAQRTAVSIPVVAALELCGWSLGSLPGSPALALGCEASREALMLVENIHGHSTAAVRRLQRPSLAGLVLSLAPRLAPLDLGAYLAFHFQKTAAQTRWVLETARRLGEERGLPTSALAELREQLG